MRRDTAFTYGSSELLGVHKADLMRMGDHFPKSMHTLAVTAKNRMLKIHREREMVRRVIGSNSQAEDLPVASRIDLINMELREMQGRLDALCSVIRRFE